eukprot:scaffold52431_cov63-Phaeocystis_antarctica.AAC.1
MTRSRLDKAERRSVMSTIAPTWPVASMTARCTRSRAFSRTSPALLPSSAQKLVGVTSLEHTTPASDLWWLQAVVTMERLRP